MTNRINSLTVILEKDARDDDDALVCGLIRAIGMFRGVLSIQTNVATPQDTIAYERAKREFQTKLYKLMYEEED